MRFPNPKSRSKSSFRSDDSDTARKDAPAFDPVAAYRRSIRGRPNAGRRSETSFRSTACPCGWRCSDRVISALAASARPSRVVPHSSRERPRGVKKRREPVSNEPAGQRPDSTIVPAGESGPQDTLKVETRVRTPLGLPAETHRRSSRLHPGQGADTGFDMPQEWMSCGPGTPRHPSLVPHSSRERTGSVAKRRQERLPVAHREQAADNPRLSRGAASRIARAAVDRPPRPRSCSVPDRHG
jgi:hypothetical protein